MLIQTLKYYKLKKKNLKYYSSLTLQQMPSSPLSTESCDNSVTFWTALQK